MAAAHPVLHHRAARWNGNGVFQGNVAGVDAGLDKKTARCVECQFRQVHARQARLNVGPLTEQVANLILQRQDHGWLKWYKDGRVRVLIGKVLPDDLVTQTLARRRKRFRAAPSESGWQAKDGTRPGCMIMLVRKCRQVS